MSNPLPTSEVIEAPAPPCVVSASEADEWFRDQIYPHDLALKSYLRSRFPAVRDVEDVVQESYARTWKAKLATKIDNSKSFLFSVARNLARDVLRKKRRTPIVELPEVDPTLVLDDAPGIVETAVKQDDLDLLARVLASLPTRCRTIMILCRVEGLSQKEVAERLGLAASTVETQVGNGLARMKAYLASHPNP